MYSAAIGRQGVLSDRFLSVGDKVRAAQIELGDIVLSKILCLLSKNAQNQTIIRKIPLFYKKLYRNTHKVLPYGVVRFLLLCSQRFTRA